MNILAIDTSQPTGSIALQMRDADPVCRLFGRASSHLVEMSEAVEHLLGETDTTIRDIERVALVIGPGSFTGLRIGLSYVKGLCALGRIDLVTMTSLELLAAPYLAAHGIVCTMIDARKSEVYAAVYEASAQKLVPSIVGGAPQAASPQEFLAMHTDRRMLFVGSGARRFETMIRDMFGARGTLAPYTGDQPSTPLLCRMASGLAVLSRREIRQLEPFYIRPSDAKLSSLQRIQIHEEPQARPDE